MDNDKMLLVLTVLGGRHFPKKSGWQLTVEAKFDGEAMFTDPVNHLASPVFNTELGWEVDRRTLHVLKINRTPVRVSCYAQELKTGAKESVGYIILDLTHAQQPTMKPKWFPILNCKYQTKPELLLSLGLENDSQEAERHSKKERDVHSAKARDYPEKDCNNLVPILNEEMEYYQIGPVDTCNCLFSFSVTIGFASNLEQLISSTTVLPSNHQGFFFYYLLLGNEIYTDRFQDVIGADFVAERATVQIRSSVEALEAYFLKQKKIQVHLCCQDKSLGYTDVSLINVLTDASQDFDKPIIIENSYELKTSNQSQITKVPEELKPYIGIVITLKKEETVNVVEPVVLNSSVNVPTTEDYCKTPPSVKRNLKFPQTPPQKLEKEPLDVQKSTIPIEVSDEDDKLPELPLTPKSNKMNEFTNDTQEHGLDDLVTYSLCIDLRILKNIGVSKEPFNCFLRYSYQYFGDVAPIVTHPTVDVRLGCSSILPHGYATFSFMTQPKQLDEIFRKNPIKIEVVHKDLVRKKDIVIGSCLLHLGLLLDEEKSLTVDETGRSGWRRSLLSTLPVISLESHCKVAEIQLFIAIDDFGVSEPETILNKDLESEQHDLHSKTLPAPHEALEDRLAQQAAQEIEKWKAFQEAIFANQLQEKETKYMEAITNEWTQRETERELLVQKRLSEYQDLEENLKQAFANVEKRERELVLCNAKAERMKTDLQLEYERKMQKVKDASRRQKDEFDHKIELEKSKYQVLQDECAKLRRRVDELEKKLERKEAEFLTYKEHKSQPEIRLQADYNLLNIDNLELKRKVNSLTASKIHYKQQYGRCLRELASLKHTLQSEAQAQLQKQRQELEQMRLEIIASEKQDTLEGQRQVIRELKMSKPGKQPIKKTKPNSAIADEMKHQRGLVLSKREQMQLTRLQEEKEILLRTGLYNKADEIIVELETQINKLLQLES